MEVWHYIPYSVLLGIVNDRSDCKVNRQDRMRLFLLLSTLTAALAGSVPAKPEGVQTLTTANNVTIRYKEPGKEGVCETTPGVKSYSGYVDLSPTSHTFFYFFEARHDPQNAPITLWLNGGPGSDSLIGLFQGREPSSR